MALKIRKRQKSAKFDLNEPGTRAQVLKQLGIEEPKPKTSFLKRLGSLLSFTETGNAAFKLAQTGDPLEALKTYTQDVVQGIGGAITGDVNEDKKTYSDVLRIMGVDNKLVKGVVGFGLDVVADPGTYLSFGTKAVSTVGGKALTTAGKKVAKNAGESFTKRIANELGAETFGEISKKFANDDIFKAAEKVAKNAEIALKNPVGHNKSLLELQNAFVEKRIQKISRLSPATELFTGAIEKGNLTGVEKLGVTTVDDLFSPKAARFAGKELFRLGPGAEIAGKAVFDPLQLVGKVTKNLPFVQKGTEKIRGLATKLRDGFGQLFVHNYDLKKAVAGLRQFGKDTGFLTDAINNIARSEGADVAVIAKRLEGLEDVDLLPDLVEDLLPHQIREVEKFLQKSQGSAEHLLKKEFGIKPSGDIAERGQQWLKAFYAGDVDGMTDISNTFSNQALRKSFLDQTEQFTRFNGKYVKVGKSLVLNEQDGLAKFALELREKANQDQELLKKLKLPNWLNYFGRKVKEILGRPVDDIGNPLPKGFEDFNLFSTIGSGRVYQFRRHGINEGQVLYEMQDALGGKKWSQLDKAGKKNVRDVVTSRIYEQKAKIDVVRKYSDFLDYTANKGTTDFGEKLAVKPTNAAEKVALEVKGWVEPKIPGADHALKGHLIPKEAAEVLENSYKTFFTDKGTNDLLKLYDKAQSMWKSSVTKFFPGFHVRNLMSNIFSNAMSGLTNPGRYADAMNVQKYINKLAEPGISKEVVQKLSGKKVGKYTMNEWVEILEGTGVISAGNVWTEMSGKLDNLRPGEAVRLGDDNILKKISNKVDFAGNAVEDNARIALFMDRVNKGDGFSDALQKVKNVLFDYSELTPFEKNVGRRVIPFYTWQRKNAEFMLRYATANPGKFGAILKGMRSVQDSFTDLDEEDIEAMPAWMKKGFAILGKGKEGKVTSLTGFGTPIEAFGQLVDGLTMPETRTALNFIGPIPRGILEKSTGISLFTGKRIKNDTDGRKFRGMPGFLKDAIGYREFERSAKDGSKYTEYVIDPNKKWVLNTFLGRSISEIGALTDIEEDPTLLPVANWLTGIKRYERSIEQEQLNREREAAQRMLDILIGKGLAKETTTARVRKEAKEELGF